MNPYLSVWINPKTTVDSVLEGGLKFNFIIPVLLIGISGVIGNLNSDFSFTESLILILFGILISILILGYLLPWLILKTGKLWKGQSNFQHLQQVLGLAQIPVLVILLVQVVSLFGGQQKLPEQINFMVRFIVWIFYTRILIIGIAKSQGFTYPFAIMNLILSLIPFFCSGF